MGQVHSSGPMPLLESLEDRLLLAYNYALTDIAPVHVAQGHDLYVSMNCTSTAASAENVWLTYTTPAGVTVSGMGNTYFYQISSANSGVYPLLFKISVSPTAALGSFNVLMNGESDGTHIKVTQAIPIIIDAMPPVLPAAQFNTAPQPIDPAVLSNWESRMTTSGAIYGTPQQISATWNESGTWYYDGERVFYQIADYTGDSSWNTPAETSESVYRPYVLTNGGSVFGWRNFGMGLAMDYEREAALSQERTDDATAVTGLFVNAHVYEPSMADVSWSRETAYCIDSGLAALRIGQSIDQVKLQRYVDVSLGFIDQWFVTKRVDTAGYILQPFMAGLTCEALIGWYQYTVSRHNTDSSYPIDTRIPGAIKAAADWLVGQTGGLYNAWNTTYNCFDYMLHYATPTVDITQTTAIDVDEYTNQLNLLIAPAFGWLYHMYGETNGAFYRQWGDTIFAGGVACELDTGKQFSQNYRMSIDYVQWRTNNPWANDAIAPMISTYAEKALTSTGNYITWKTDEATWSVVEYGATSSYGSMLTNALLMQNHRQEITGLTQGSTYHYRIKATDASGNVSYSPDRTFVAGADTRTVTIAATDRDATENSSDTGTFTFTRSNSVGSLTVNYTISGTAGNGVDYQTIGTTVNFANGETTKTVTITPLNDAIAEPTEMVTLTLAEASGYDLQGINTATVRIFDDDNPVQTATVSVIDGSAYEDTPGDTATWRITRNSTAGSLTVYYTISSQCEGFENNGVQYQVIPTSVTFAPGQSFKDVVLTPIDDDFLEGSVDMELTLVETPQVDYRLGSPLMGTIYLPTNDSTVNVTATDPSASEAGDAGTFTINRTCYDGRGATVYFTLTGTATNGTDYVTVPLSVTFSPTEFSKVITINPIADGISEGDETVILTLIAPVGCDYNIGWGPGSDTVTITDVDPGLPLVSVAAQDASASETGPDTGTYRISRTGSTTSALTVYYAMSGTASSTSGTDYTLSGTWGTALIPVGASYVDVTLTPVDDSTIEGSETAILTISTDAAYTVGTPGSNTVTIADNDFPTVSVAAQDAIASETGPDTGTYRISRIGSTTSALTVYYAMSGTASSTSGTDYTLSGTWGTAIIPTGAAYVDVTLTPVDDSTIEGSETAILTISTNAGYTIGSPANGTVTIADNDFPVVTLSVRDASASETSSNTGQYRVTRTGSTSSSLTVYYAMGGTASNTSGVDYTLSGTWGVATISSGSTYVNITLTPIDDTVIGEGTETAILTITTNANYTVGSPSSGTVNIADNDLPTVSVAAQDASASEIGPDTGTFRISRNGLTVNALIVNYSLSGTASTTSGTDYTLSGTWGTATIPVGASYVDVTLTPVDDSIRESAETAVLTVSTNAAYSVGSPSNATVTIAASDSTVSIVATDPDASEPGDTGTFTITRIANDNAAITVSYTITGSALGGADYVTIPTSVTFAAGELSKTITVTPIDDDIYESAKTVTLTLTAPGGCQYDLGATTAATVTIADDDSIIDVTAPDALASEATLDGGVWRLTRTGNTDRTLTVTYALGGSATAGSDYTTSPTGTSVTFAAGETTKDIVLAPINDHDVDQTATLSLVTSPSCHYSAGVSGSADILIAGSPPGDANGDGLVDQDDYKVWYDNYGTGTTWEQGNFKGCGLTDQEDYAIWYNNYGARAGGGASTLVASPAAALEMVASAPAETTAKPASETLESAPVATAATALAKTATAPAGGNLLTAQHRQGPAMRRPTRIAHAVPIADDEPLDLLAALSALAMPRA